MSENTNNPVYKLVTDNLQLVLINVLIRSIFDTKVSQGSVATSLRYGGIINAQSMMSPTVKEFLKSVNISRSYRQE